MPVRDPAAYSTEKLLLLALRELVKEDAYYPVQDIKMKIMELFYARPKNAPRWLTNTWVGRALRRLRIGEGRRLGTHREYRITPSQIEDLLSGTGPSPTQ